MDGLIKQSFQQSFRSAVLDAVGRRRRWFTFRNSVPRRFLLRTRRQYLVSYDTITSRVGSGQCHADGYLGTLERYGSPESPWNECVNFTGKKSQLNPDRMLSECLV